MTCSTCNGRKATVYKGEARYRIEQVTFKCIHKKVVTSQKAREGGEKDKMAVPRPRMPQLGFADRIAWPHLKIKKASDQAQPGRKQKRHSRSTPNKRQAAQRPAPAVRGSTVGVGTSTDCSKDGNEWNGKGSSERTRKGPGGKIHRGIPERGGRA